MVGVWVQVLRIPRPYLYAASLLFVALDRYSLIGLTADPIILFVAGLLGKTTRRFDHLIAPLVVGLILGRLAEAQLRGRKGEVLSARGRMMRRRPARTVSDVGRSHGDAPRSEPVSAGARRQFHR